MRRDYLPIVTEPACRHLLSKGMYITGKRNPGVEDGAVGDGNCWCGRTQHMLGPDDRMAERAACIPGRTCYELIL